MSTAVSLRSESSDHYIFAMDTSAQLTIEKFCEEICKESFVGESLYVEASTSDQFNERELECAVAGALDDMEVNQDG